MSSVFSRKITISTSYSQNKRPCAYPISVSEHSFDHCHREWMNERTSERANADRSINQSIDRSYNTTRASAPLVRITYLGMSHRSRNAIEIAHRTQANIEIELLTQRNIQRPNATTDRSGERTFDSNQVIAIRIECGLWQPVARGLESLLSCKNLQVFQAQASIRPMRSLLTIATRCENDAIDRAPPSSDDR
jgi:hypothetical protein